MTFFVKPLQEFADENYEYGRAVGKGKRRREKGKGRREKQSRSWTREG
jgi:hypothetical protein